MSTKMKGSNAHRHRVFVGFGSNVGNRRRYIESALEKLSLTPGISLKRVSPLYYSSPVGGPRQRAFYNGVAELTTNCSPARLLVRMKKIEKELGRVRTVRWGPRTIDLDLLSYDRIRTKKKSLTLPHPRYHERRFVLAPFVDIAPGYVHPLLKCRNSTLLKRLPPAQQRATMVGTWKKQQFRLF